MKKGERRTSKPGARINLLKLVVKTAGALTDRGVVL